MGGDRVSIAFRDAADLAPGVEAVRGVLAGEPEIDAAERRLVVPVSDGAASLVRVAAALDAAGVGVEDLGLRRPTLDEVFLALTDAPAREKEAA